VPSIGGPSRQKLWESNTAGQIVYSDPRRAFTSTATQERLASIRPARVKRVARGHHPTDCRRLGTDKSCRRCLAGIGDTCDSDASKCEWSDTEGGGEASVHAMLESVKPQAVAIRAHSYSPDKALRWRADPARSQDESYVSTSLTDLAHQQHGMKRRRADQHGATMPNSTSQKGATRINGRKTAPGTQTSRSELTANMDTHDTRRMSHGIGSVLRAAAMPFRSIADLSSAGAARHMSYSSAGGATQDLIAQSAPEHLGMDSSQVFLGTATDDLIALTSNSASSSESHLSSLEGCGRSSHCSFSVAPSAASSYSSLESFIPKAVDTTSEYGVARSAAEVHPPKYCGNTHLDVGQYVHGQSHCYKT
jgi:hypothetical protein